MSGILLHGLPGVGKKAALYAAIDAVKKKLAVGDKELTLLRTAHHHICTPTTVDRVFQEAELHAPSVLLVEYADGVIGKRDDSEGIAAQLQRTIVSGVLCGVDKLARRPVDPSPVAVVLITQFKNALDEALLEPTRIDTHIRFPLPCAEEISFKSTVSH